MSATVETQPLEHRSPSSSPLDAARALREVLASHAAADDAARRLVPASVSALSEAGLFRLGAPVEFGGAGADLRTIARVGAELARGCGACGWIASFSAASATMLDVFDPRARADVWAEGPDVPLAVSLAPAGTVQRAGDSHVLRGSWSWVTGVHHARWVLLAARIVDEAGEDDPHPVPGPPRVLVALVPAAELSVRSTWFTAGMRGTGSDTVSAQDLVVPTHRTAPLQALLTGLPVPVAGVPSPRPRRTATATALAPTIAGPIVGMARSALDAAQEITLRKPMSMSPYSRLADAPSVQLAVADAARLVDTAELHLLRAADDLDAVPRTDGLSPTTRARVRMDIGTVATCCQQAVELLVNVCGAGSVLDGTALQRIWRDVSTATRHALLNPGYAREVYGRALLGLPDLPGAPA